jgi:hypothetical protein
LSSEMKIGQVKKLLGNTYTFLSEGELSDRGMVSYAFEAKMNTNYIMNILYSTVFTRVTYIQFYNDIKKSAFYRSEFLKLGFTYSDTKFSQDGQTQSFGYKKGKLLYVLEFGVQRGQCKIHLSNTSF